MSNERKDIADDPVYLDNKRQDEYYRSIGGRDPEPTYREGWKERYARIVEDAPE